MPDKEKSFDLPKELVITDDYEIGEWITNGKTTALRILLSPSKCYLNDDVVGLEEIIREIVGRYNLQPRVFQLHYQSKIDGSLKFVEQSGEIYTQSDLQWWIKQVEQESPLPPEAEWLLCNENSEHFLRTYAHEEVKEAHAG